MDREDKNLNFGVCFPDLACCLESFKCGIPPQLLRLNYRLPGIYSLVGDSPAALSVNESPYAMPDELVVISREDGKSLGVCCHLRVWSRGLLCRCCGIQYPTGRRTALLAPACSGCRLPLPAGTLRSVFFRCPEFHGLCPSLPV